MHEPRPSTPGRTHRIAAAFDTEDDANEALRDLEPFRHEIQVDVHLPGCHEVDEAERGVGVTMLRSILVAVPITMLTLLAVFLLFNDLLGDLSFEGVLAVAIGAGGIFGILLGGIAGLAISQRRLEEAQTLSNDHLGRPDEVLVAHVLRGGVHNPNLRRAEYAGRRDREVVEDLETQIRQVFTEHNGHLIDA